MDQRTYKECDEGIGILLVNNFLQLPDFILVHGKTPPCADLIVRKGVKRCVCGCVDPFAKVQGRGIRKIREAGIEVTVGVLEAECLELNKRFITFNTHQRPYIILKWAQTANGFLDNGGRGMAISSPFTKMLSHKLRAENDAILIGRVTDERDHSQLNVRDWSGKDPMRLVIDLHHPCFEGLDFSRGKTEVLQQIMQYLYNNKVQSLIVEGGAITHQAFLDAGLWDEIRVETLLSTSVENSVTSGTPAPMLPHNVRLISHEAYTRFGRVRIKCLQLLNTCSIGRPSGANRSR